MSGLETLLKDCPLAVFDVETTGLSPRFDRICEVGIVRARDGEVLETYQTLVNPQRPISPGAARVNGLSDEDVADAPTFAEIAGQVCAFIDGAIVVCHNAPFDLGFLRVELGRLGLNCQPAGVIDTLELARRRFHYGSNSLESLAARLGIANPAAHRALGDALTTFEVWRRLSGQQGSAVASQLAQFPRPFAPDSLAEVEAVLPPELLHALAHGEEIEIGYIDAKGDETCRRVTPRQALAENGAVYLVAFCHLRQAERYFRLDRIVIIRK